MPVTSSTSSIKRWPSVETILGALEDWGAAAAERRDDLVALGYFGSYARGDAGFASDLDLIVYTADEWERLQAENGRFARTLNAEARWLLKR